MRSKKMGKPLTVIIGTGVAAIVLTMTIALLTGFILNEQIGEGIGDKIICSAHILAVLSGAEISRYINGGSGIKTSGMVAAIYGVLVAVTAMLLEGEFRNVGINILVICLGLFISCAFCICKTRRNGKRKKRVW